MNKLKLHSSCIVFVHTHCHKQNDINKNGTRHMNACSNELRCFDKNSVISHRAQNIGMRKVHGLWTINQSFMSTFVFFYFLCKSTIVSIMNMKH